MSSPGQCMVVVAVDPETICCEDALLASALLSVGVPQSAHFPFEITNEAGVTRWTWIFEVKSTDGKYKADDLVKWWRDPAWLAANPAHEWALVHAVLHNMATLAEGVRNAVPRAVVTNGLLQARIPANASPARKQWLLDQVTGRIPVGQKFQSTSADSAE